MSVRSKKLFVANVSGRTTDKEIEDLFTPYGKVVELIVKDGRASDRFAFVEFETEDQAADALERVSGYELQGRQLRIEYAHGARRDKLASAGRGSSSSGCYICHERGHMAKDCSKGNGQGTHSHPPRRHSLSRKMLHMWQSEP
eukprot:TRINITY_DN7769_c0_g3_i9.p1 TRINITY_DN7769_c0_g3~~TRINITY_DN7769_c0_g3_i9.p1  ORF type:complete len:143 (-),score=20.70 TRINITY_DN7769_c0_g3_i9:82-510(-)